MQQYLIILLDNTSVSYCHYEVTATEHCLIPLDTLKAGILFAMKENLSIQFVYPAYDLPETYGEVIESIDHVKIKPLLMSKGADVIVVDGCNQLVGMSYEDGMPYVLRTDKADLFVHYRNIVDALSQVTRLNVVLTDVDTFTEEDFFAYKQVLQELSGSMEDLYAGCKYPQLNLLTDRTMLKQMNNCGAGEINLTLAPNGSFYVCPAFYYADKLDSVGDLMHGLDLKNGQLYRLDHAPLCRICDAYQCKRCVWLNRKTTYEVNTPSHEQCVVAHLERNASRGLLNGIRKYGSFLQEQDDIKEINYLDPFDIKKEW